MPATPRDVVTAALRFDYPPRLPRDLWTLPWAERRFPRELAEMRRRFPSDFVAPPDVYTPSSRLRGDPYATGQFVDEWGCAFVSVQGH